MPFNTDHSSRNNPFAEQSLLEHIRDQVPAIIKWGADRARARLSSVSTAYTRLIRRSGHSRGIWALLRSLLTVRTALILLWGFTLWWGERTVFRQSLRACEWQKWESWPADATPHHVAFIADPQLVDAHTYPGRPWPLSSLTEFYTDLYLFRTYSLLQRYLRPDSTIFLGDLFDGGREWGMEGYSSPDPQFKDYGNDVWMNEYKRFSRIFFNTWSQEGEASSSSQGHRQIIAGLPGNHDFGFGNGVHMPVVNRFRSFFGASNRVDVIGNHTVISVDSLSLSAMEQDHPETGGSNTGHKAMKEIWKETAEFLNDIKEWKQDAIRRELPVYAAEHSDPASSKSEVQLPTILLTHVPLYREPHTPCGPLREHWPPSSTDPLPDKDERNAIQISKGYQYQNVLTTAISNEIVNKAGPIAQIYSGDDHDYCEIVHREFSDAPTEITVKSMSIAMSVRLPAVQLAALWNPIDPKSGLALDPSGSSKTLQNHMCLLPDQISIFIRYGYTLALTVAVLLVHAASLALRPRAGSSSPAADSSILPLAYQRSSDDYYPRSAEFPAASTSTTSSNAIGGTHSVTRSRAASTTLPYDGRGFKQVQTSGGGAVDRDDGAVGSAASATMFSDNTRSRRLGWGDDSYHDAFSPERGLLSSQGARRPIHVFGEELVSSISWVGGIAVLWYLWLLWTW